MTHAEDFAPPFVKLLGHPDPIGEDFHLTSEHRWSWNVILGAAAEALDVSDYRFVHVASDTLVRYNRDWEGPLLGAPADAIQITNSSGVTSPPGIEGKTRNGKRSIAAQIRHCGGRSRKNWTRLVPLIYDHGGSQ